MLWKFPRFSYFYIGRYILVFGLETLIKHPLPNWYLHWEEPWTKFPFCFPSFPSSFYLEFIKNLIVSRNRGQIFNTFVLKGAWHFIPWEFIPFYHSLMFSSLASFSKYCSHYWRIFSPFDFLTWKNSLSLYLIDQLMRIKAFG